MAPSLFIVASLGLLTGLIGRRLVRGRQSVFGAAVAGFAGAVLAVPIAEALGYPVEGLGPLLLAALAGSVVLLAAWRLLARR